MRKSINFQVLLCSGMLIFITSTPAAMATEINSVSDKFLAEFIQSAVAKHPEVLAEIASVDTRSALERAAGKAIYNPELEFDAERTADDTISIGFNQTIDFGNKRSARKKVAASERSVSLARLSSIRNKVASVLLNSLAQFHSAKQQIELAERRLDIVTEFSELANRRYRAGDLNQTELNIANIALIQAQIEFATLESSHAEAEQALRLQSQITNSFSWPELPTRLPTINVDSLNTDSLVAALPEVQVAKNEVNVLTSQVDLRQRERKPDPTVGIRAGGDGSDTLVGINLSIPLYIRNNFNDEVFAAQSQKNEAEYRYQTILNRAQSRLIASTKRYQFTQAAWQNWEGSGQSGYEIQTELLKRLWEAGELSTTEYLVQLNQTLDTQASATELRYQLWRSWVDWISVSGEINNWLALKNNK